ncbi:hypothetical protein G6L37_03125 [Agrobacterium rubi]|nr:hypothetical protein [Agrobacterium rubi]NTF24367.1 hypothetical protein [Agrobacterium rubi]
MYEPNPANGNRYLYHWVAPDRLEISVDRGALRPYWKHWIHDLGRFERGVSTSFDPVRWMPVDGEADGEPCIVIDRSAFEHRAIEIDSGETYHLTRSMAAALRSGADTRSILERVDTSRRITFGFMDEVFIMDAIPTHAVAAIGYEPERMYWQDLEIIRSAADTLGVPLIRMDGWVDNPPDRDDLDRLIGEAIAGHGLQANP